MDPADQGLESRPQPVFHPVRRQDAGLLKNRNPNHLHKILYTAIEFTIRGNEVSLFESRPHLQGGGEWISMKVARFKKDPKTETWHLYWADRNSKWRPYPPLPFHRDIEKLLQEVEKNETGAFWG
jgi:hypothetical protein